MSVRRLVWRGIMRAGAAKRLLLLHNRLLFSWPILCPHRFDGATRLGAAIARDFRVHASPLCFQRLTDGLSL
jgi:hypothetical protein